MDMIGHDNARKIITDTLISAHLKFIQDDMC